MKKILFLALVLPTLFLEFVGFGAVLKIGVSLPTQAEEHWVRDKKAMEETAVRLGVDLKVQITNNDSARQMSQVENLLSQGIQVLVIAPHDSDSAGFLVEKAKKLGVKVIAYDRMIKNADLDLFVATDNIKVGELQGEYLARKVPKGRYIILSGSPTDYNASLFKEGAMKFLQPLIAKGDIEVIVDQAVRDWQPAEAQKIVEQALTKSKNKIDAILAPNDGTAGGAIQALSSQGLAGKVVVTGLDAEIAAANRLIKGTQSMTVFKNSVVMSEQVIELAVKLAKGESLGQAVTSRQNNGKFDVPSVLYPGQVIEKADIEPILVRSGFFKNTDLIRR